RSILCLLGRDADGDQWHVVGGCFRSRPLLNQARLNQLPCGFYAVERQRGERVQLASLRIDAWDLSALVVRILWQAIWQRVFPFARIIVPELIAQVSEVRLRVCQADPALVDDLTAFEFDKAAAGLTDEERKLLARLVFEALAAPRDLAGLAI